MSRTTKKASAYHRLGTPGLCALKLNSLTKRRFAALRLRTHVLHRVWTGFCGQNSLEINVLSFL